MSLNYSKEPRENTLQRIALLQSCYDTNKDYQKNRAAVMKQCGNDILFFVDMFGWTYNPRLDNSDIQFITYPFQVIFLQDMIKNIELERDSCTEKSRDMGYSWLLVAIHCYGFLFRGWASLYGSYKENFVDNRGDMDSFFERCRYFLSRLPEWMKPSDMIDKYMGISSEALGCSISGDSGENFGTGGRRKFVTHDEYALWQNDAKAFRKTKDVTNCRIFGGTPEGKFNVYGKIMTKHRDYVHLDMQRIRLHWSLHPLKTDEWYEKQKRSRTKLDIAKELDISYDDSVTGAVYKDFNTLATFGKYDFDPDLRLFTSWDFGRDMTAIIWWQKCFKTGRIFIIDAFQKPDTDIDFFSAFVTGQEVASFAYNEDEREMIERHKGWKHAYSNHFGDPYNGQSRSVVTTSTVQTVLARYGINMVFNRASKLEERIKKVELATRRMFVHDDLYDFIQAIIQSRYPETKEGREGTSEKTKPIHDINSHFRTALEYGIDNEPDHDLSKQLSNADMMANMYAERERERARA